MNRRALMGPSARALLPYVYGDRRPGELPWNWRPGDIELFRAVGGLATTGTASIRGTGDPDVSRRYYGQTLTSLVSSSDGETGAVTITSTALTPATQVLYRLPRRKNRRARRRS